MLIFPPDDSKIAAGSIIAVESTITPRRRRLIIFRLLPNRRKSRTTAYGKANSLFIIIKHLFLNSHHRLSSIKLEMRFPHLPL